jgi:hypothetical protein
MEYPTLEQVDAANALQLAQWFRFLPTPGVNAVKTTQPIDKVNAAIAHEGEIMDRIIRRLAEPEVMTMEVCNTILFPVGDPNAGSNS